METEGERKPSPTLIIQADGSEEFWFNGKKWDSSFKCLVKDLTVIDLRQIAQARIDDNETEDKE